MRKVESESSSCLLITNNPFGLMVEAGNVYKRAMIRTVSGTLMLKPHQVILFYDYIPNVHKL